MDLNILAKCSIINSPHLVREYLESVTDYITVDTFSEKIHRLRILADTVQGMKYNFYRTNLWKKTTAEIKRRDDYKDLGIKFTPERLHVHHIIPPYFCCSPELFYDEFNLITVSTSTHNYIHGGDIYVQ